MPADTPATEMLLDALLSIITNGDAVIARFDLTRIDDRPRTFRIFLALYGSVGTSLTSAALAKAPPEIKIHLNTDVIANRLDRCSHTR